MSPELRSYVTGTAGLSLLLIVSVLLTLTRGRVLASVARSSRFTAVIAVAVGAQVLHFLEELSTRFYERFPAQLGLEPWGVRFFAVFNVAWILIWLLAAFGVRAQVVPALIPLWFLALALALNFVAHTVLALAARGYFPGLVTAPPAGVAGVLLFRLLFDLTARCEGPPDSSAARQGRQR